MKIYQEIKNSSAILAFEYDTETLILSIHFASGGKYDYPGIPQELVKNWMEGLKEKNFPTGRYFNQKIRNFEAS